MIERCFLGWDQRFVASSAEWLLRQGKDLSGLLVVVPTGHSGRSLRRELARLGGGVLPPSIATPGALMSVAAHDVAETWEEQLAWGEVLGRVEDRQRFAAAIPDWPDEVEALASELAGLRNELSGSGQNLKTAAQALRDSPEAERWAALALLEVEFGAVLQRMGLVSRLSRLSEGLSISPELRQIVVAGVTDMPRVVAQHLARETRRVTCLIPAPGELAEFFDEMGRPTADWCGFPTFWPKQEQGTVALVADSRIAAEEALRFVAERGHEPDDVVLGAILEESAPRLVERFTAAGWTAFSPVSSRLPVGFSRFLMAWRSWQQDATIDHLADLLALPETSVLLGQDVSRVAVDLARLRDAEVMIVVEHLERVLETSEQAERHTGLAEVLRRVTAIRRRVRTDPFAALREIAMTLDAPVELVSWLERAETHSSMVKRSAVIWLDYALGSLPDASSVVPDHRVVDVLGWLELLFEPGRHLLLVGMNEGSVPARGSESPWMGNQAAARLGLPTREERHARDAFLYQAMTGMRQSDGRTDVIAIKSNANGDVLKPSRILLSAKGEDLILRVNTLFRELEPPDASLRFHVDWKWQTPFREIPERLSVTSFRTYLQCPFRFYLKQVLNAQPMETGRIEWNSREFGTIPHNLLEAFAKDKEARDLSKTEAIASWLTARLDESISRHFGTQIPLAIRLQREAMARRLGWLARQQACLAAEGWQIIEAEIPIELTIMGMTIRARIDRIDKHRSTGEVRVIDYKTGKAESASKEHCARVAKNTVLPGHISHDSPVLFGDKRWLDLQLPLYVLATKDSYQFMPKPCYFLLGETEDRVKVDCWEDFNKATLDAALHCAEWVVGQIKNREFWPPAEKAKGMDYEALSAGRPMEEIFEPPHGSMQACHS